MVQKPWIVPIPDTTKLHRLKENLGGTNIELSAKKLQDIEDAAAQIKIVGDRYPASVQKAIDR